MTNHTPTPWAVTPCHTDINAYRIWDVHGNYLNEPFMEEREANAAFIVKAVNNHEALVGALEYLVEYGLTSGPRSNGLHYDSAIMKKARAILAKVKEA